MSDRPLEVRMAVAEERLDNVEEEQLRQRLRIHDLESDRATLRLVVKQMEELAANVATVARQAALEAVELAMEHKDELGNRRWALRLQWAAIGVMGGGFVVALLALVTGGS